MRQSEIGATGNCQARHCDRELSWAAGLFDGEGSVTYHAEGKRRKNGTRRIYPRLYVGNTDVRLLRRFKCAVGDLGKVRGPYGRWDQSDKSRPVKPMFHWTATHASGRAVARLLLPYLSQRNYERVSEAFPVGEEEDKVA